jgi:hypothetical protein
MAMCKPYKADVQALSSVTLFSSRELKEGSRVMGFVCLPWTCEIEDVVNMIAEYIVADTRGSMWPSILPVTRLCIRVVIGYVGNKDTDAFSVDALPSVPAVLESLVDYL